MKECTHDHGNVTSGNPLNPLVTEPCEVSTMRISKMEAVGRGRPTVPRAAATMERDSAEKKKVPQVTERCRVEITHVTNGGIGRTWSLDGSSYLRGSAERLCRRRECYSNDGALRT